jgi:hypothetical protein
MKRRDLLKNLTSEGVAADDVRKCGCEQRAEGRERSSAAGSGVAVRAIFDTEGDWGRLLEAFARVAAA